MASPPSLSREILSLAARLGTGFFADAYFLFVIDIVVLILKDLDKGGAGYNLTADRVALVTLATSLGAFLGMLLFGALADTIGRRRSSMITSTLVWVGSILSASVQQTEHFDLVDQLILIRILQGLGIGGEYPVSATFAREQCVDEKNRSRVVAAIFSMQGVGMVFSMLLTLFLVNVTTVEVTWRVLLAAGALPSAVSTYLRYHMTETAAFSSTKAPVATACSRIRNFFVAVNTMRLPLFVTASTWLLLDITFYGTGQFKSEVFDAMHPGNFSSYNDHAFASAEFGTWVALMGLPGYLCAAYIIDTYVTKRHLQISGFAALSVVFAVLAGVGISHAHPTVGLVLFGLSFFVSNLGPNTTTFVTPPSVFPDALRGTLNGAAAASGKVGAIIGSYLFASVPLPTTLWICTGIAAVGFLISIIPVEEQRVSQHSDATNSEPATVTILPEKTSHEDSDAASEECMVKVPT